MLVLAACFASVAIWAADGMPWDQLANHLRARDWPTAAAMIHEVSLHEQRMPTPSGARNDALLEITVTYSFEVEGNVFEASAASLSDLSDVHDRRLQALYLQLDYARITGRSVEARYNPSEPADAYLDIAVSWREFLPFGSIAALCGAIGLGLAVTAWRGRRQRGPAFCLR